MLAAIPLGGYVKLLDEREGPVPAAEAASAYNRKPVWQRVLVLLAGPFANFVFAVLAYWVLFVGGHPRVETRARRSHGGFHRRAGRSGARRRDRRRGFGQATPTREAAVLTILDRLMNGDARPALGAATRAGKRASHGAAHRRRARRALTEPGALLPGLGFDFWYPMSPPSSARSARAAPAREAGLAERRPDRRRRRPARSTISRRWSSTCNPTRARRSRSDVERAGREFDVPIEVEAQRDGDRLVGRIGVHPAGGQRDPASDADQRALRPLSALAHATAKTWDMSALTARMLWNVVTGDVSVKNLSGPDQHRRVRGFLRPPGRARRSCRSSRS